MKVKMCYFVLSAQRIVFRRGMHYDPGEWGTYKVVNICRPEFENGGGGLRERPLTENVGFQSGPSLKNKGDFETKNNKETYLFKKGGVFWSGPGRKTGVLSSGPGLSGGSYPYCPNMGVHPPGL